MSEPITRNDLPGATWCLLLVSSTRGRIIRGTPGEMREIATSGDVYAQLFDEFERHPFDYLAIATPEDGYTDVVNALHSYVLVKLAGRFECDIERATVAEVAEAATPLMREMERKREEAVLDRLRVDLGKGSGAVTTTREVERAFEEDRVVTLIVAPDAASGADRVIDLAIAQKAEVIVLDEAPDELADTDGIAALLRS